jgi:hypothetical protein
MDRAMPRRLPPQQKTGEERDYPVFSLECLTTPAGKMPIYLGMRNAKKYVNFFLQMERRFKSGVRLELLGSFQSAQCRRTFSP